MRSEIVLVYTVKPVYSIVTIIVSYLFPMAINPGLILYKVINIKQPLL